MGDRGLIRLDHNAGSQLHPAAAASLRRFADMGGMANPAARHGGGRAAAVALEEARKSVAELFGLGPGSVVFCSGATEANTLALKATWERRRPRKHVVVSEVEHPSVLVAVAVLERAGAIRIPMPVDRACRIDGGVLETLDPLDVAMVVLQAAHSETGVLHDVEGVAQWCSRHDVPLHVDATQRIGRLDWKPGTGVSTVAWGGTKVGGPAGTGVLALLHEGILPRDRFDPHERGARPGAPNLAGALALGALARALPWSPDEVSRHRRHSSILRAAGQSIGAVVTVEATTPVLPNTVHLMLPVPADPVLMRLDRMGIEASSGSACQSGSGTPSPALLAAGWTRREALSALRLSTGWDTTEVDVLKAAHLLIEAVQAVATVSLAEGH